MYKREEMNIFLCKRFGVYNKTFSFAFTLFNPVPIWLRNLFTQKIWMNTFLYVFFHFVFVVVVYFFDIEHLVETEMNVDEKTLARCYGIGIKHSCSLDESSYSLILWKGFAWFLHILRFGMSAGLNVAHKKCSE